MKGEVAYKKWLEAKDIDEFTRAELAEMLDGFLELVDSLKSKVELGKPCTCIKPGYFPRRVNDLCLECGGSISLVAIVNCYKNPILDIQMDNKENKNVQEK